MRVKANATTGLITLICGFYLLEYLFPSLQESLFLVNRLNFSDGLHIGVGYGEWWRILTVALVHGGLTHLGFNMWALYVLGTPLEHAFGKTRFLIIFFISLVAGSLTSLALAAQNQVSVGASGAIFGLFGAFAVVGKRIGADVRSILVLIGINFALDFILPNIDWHAHLGGLIGGALAALVILRKRRV
ncbi:MAG TPA: rhomboid family intramembrane serine protease [Candidatus Nanopelagicaceae bacterium]|jgi:membrane associated rhomboid family serine protease